MGLRIVALSDTHGGHGQVQPPDGDVLVHTGDYCKYGHMSEVKEFAKWLGGLPHRFKVVTAGNHDKAVQVLGESGHADLPQLALHAKPRNRHREGLGADPR